MSAVEMAKRLEERAMATAKSSTEKKHHEMGLKSSERREKAKAIREAMPETSLVIDEFRAVFGDVGVLYACEGATEIKTHAYHEYCAMRACVYRDGIR